MYLAKVYCNKTYEDTVFMHCFFILYRPQKVSMLENACEKFHFGALKPLTALILSINWQKILEEMI